MAESVPTFARPATGCLSRPFLAYWLVKEVRGLCCGVGDFFFLFLPAVYVTFTKLRDTTPGIFRQLANFGFSFVFSCLFLLFD